MHVQDAWDWMVPHWCDRSESIWPVKQIEAPKLDINRPQEYAGLVYSHVTAAADAGNAYTLRSRHYALLYHSLRGGPDPKHEMDEARVRPQPRAFHAYMLPWAQRAMRRVQRCELPC